MVDNKRRIITVLMVLLLYSLSLLFTVTFCENHLGSGTSERSEDQTIIEEQPSAEGTAAPETSENVLPSDSQQTDFDEDLPDFDQAENSSQTQAGTNRESKMVADEVSPAKTVEEAESAAIQKEISQPEDLSSSESDRLIEEPIEEPFIEEDPFDPDAFVEEADDDFWADFYVAGEEDVSLFEDGEYYVPLYINDEYVTDMNIIFEGESLLIDLAEFESIIGESLIPSVYETLFEVEVEQISLQTLNALGIDGYYDYQTFELYLYFPTWMLPRQTLSINRTGLTRFSTYEMTGSTLLQRQWFSTFSNLTFYSNVTWAADEPFEITPSSIFTMQSQSSFNLFDVSFDYSYLLHPGLAYDTSDKTWSSDISDYITFNGIQGFYDFTDKSLRLSFGNVNDYLGLDNDTLGIGLEKQYNYGDLTASGHQYEYEVQLDEPSVVEVFINDTSVYRRELQAGIYELQDFVFEQGVNKARIEITPLDGSEETREVYFDIDYDSRLMAKGDSLYSLALSVPTSDLLDPTFRIEQSAGLTHEFTGSYSFASSLSAMVLSFNLLYASPIGTLSGDIYMSLNEPLGFGFAGSTVYALPDDDELSLIGDFSFSLGYSSKRYTSSVDVDSTSTAADGDTLSGSFGFSGRISDVFRYSFSTTVGWDTSESDISLNASLNTGLSLIPNLALSGTVSYTKSSGTSTGTFTYQVSGNYTFSKNLSLTLSSDIENSSYISGSIKPFGSDSNSIRFNLSGLTFSDPLDHQGSLYYSYIGKTLGLTLSQQYSESFTEFSTSLSVSTAIAYADGLFGITRSISDNFLLVKPEGAMKNQQIAVTKTMTTDPERLPRLFGTSSYTGLSSHTENNIVVYGVGDELLNSSESFIYDLNPRPRQGYAVRVSSEMAYSIVGNILRSPSSAYERYTTEIAKVELDENDEEVLFFDESQYLFTDENGFYFVSGLPAGTYQFSIFLPGALEEDPPIDIRFTLEDLEGIDRSMVIVLDTFIASDVAQILEDEEFEILLGNTVEDPLLDDNGIYWLDSIDMMDEETFWDSFYPKRLVIENVNEQTASTAGSDAIIELINAQSNVPTSALQVLIQDDPGRLNNLTRLREVIADFIDATSPRQFELTGNIIRPTL
ncbi:MAG: hypothetical protein PQJ47_12425 [Sphaerochaetaceae bacterium]|nr:hypothetical protein [Sphaerochaetaceae bacterium]